MWRKRQFKKLQNYLKNHVDVELYGNLEQRGNLNIPCGIRLSILKRSI